jgi:DNA-directed RNA polymerase delta subunit
MKQYSLTQIRKELLNINSLTTKERNIIYQELKRFKGGGGISFSELQKVIWKLRDEYKISEIDEKYLKRLLNNLK